MKKIFAILCVGLISSLSQANINADGAWNGWLYWSFDGVPTRCISSMQYRQTAVEFERISGNLECDFVAMDMGSRSWTLSNGKIFEGTQAVGTYGNNAFEWSENYSPTVMIRSQLKVEARHMDYQEVWFRKSDNAEIYAIQGRLFKRDQTFRKSKSRQRVIRRL